MPDTKGESARPDGPYRVHSNHIFFFFLFLYWPAGVDESLYYRDFAKHLSLSYFDHPPLHLWITHFAAAVLGENVAVRGLFVCLFFATSLIYYRFVRREHRCSISAYSDFCTKRYSFLFRLRRGVGRSGWAAAFWASGGGVGGEPTIFSATGRGGFGLAVLAACRPGYGFSGTV